MCFSFIWILTHVVCLFKYESRSLLLEGNNNPTVPSTKINPWQWHSLYTHFVDSSMRFLMRSNTDDFSLSMALVLDCGQPLGHRISHLLDLLSIAGWAFFVNEVPNVLDEIQGILCDFACVCSGVRGWWPWWKTKLRQVSIKRLPYES